MWRGSFPRLLVVTLLGVFAGAALAAEPVRLPAGEDPTVWVEPLRLADLVVGTPGDGAWVVIDARGEAWTLRVRDARGRVQETIVPRPDTPREREDLALLARSLLRSASGASWDDVGALAPLPSPPPAAASPRPAPPVPPRPPRTRPRAPGEPPVWGDQPAAPAAEGGDPSKPWGVDTPAPAPPLADPAPPTAPAPPPGWARVGLAAAVRSDAAAGGALSVAGGVLVSSRARVGAALAWCPPRALDVGADRALTAYDVVVEGGSALLPRDLLVVELAAGVSVRPYAQAGERITTTVIPITAASLAGRLALGGPVSVGPYVEGRLDLRGTELREEVAPLDELTRVELRAGLRVEFLQTD